VGTPADEERDVELRGVGDRWMAGERVDGVTFGPRAPVEITGGAHAGTRAVVALLADVREEPVYLVELDAGGVARVRQSWLRTPA
jgi:hypothetical protein